ncbi:hypothetical protein [Xenophilus sp. Marseille-Q4582]|uniref:hypothetical protein n=1 Tax=Xenophilus sp. Marseille-Q4582 TaxID=2866600 RepID=UPI001CE3E4E5|nr:hypothetical protein [Xenophilus sp. Marseille-Q4582]
MTRDPSRPAADPAPDDAAGFDASDKGSHLPAQKAMKQFAKNSDRTGAPAPDPAARREQAERQQQRLTEGDKPVGASANDGSSPYEEPNHPAKNQRDR